MLWLVEQRHTWLLAPPLPLLFIPLLFSSLPLPSFLLLFSPPSPLFPLPLFFPPLLLSLSLLSPPLLFSLLLPLPLFSPPLSLPSWVLARSSTSASGASLMFCSRFPGTRKSNPKTLQDGSSGTFGFWFEGQLFLQRFLSGSRSEVRSETALVRWFPLEGAEEAHEDQHMQEEQIEEEEVSRTGAARQQPGEVQAPPPEPLPAQQDSAHHLRRHEETDDGWMEGWMGGWRLRRPVPSGPAGAGGGPGSRPPTPPPCPCRCSRLSGRLWTNCSQKHRSCKVNASTANQSVPGSGVRPSLVSDWLHLIESPLQAVLRQTQGLLSRLSAETLLSQTLLHLHQPGGGGGGEP